ncbi:DMT family transporter [Streptococcus sp. X16XC17]|uniref:DMT family transporter n=1 Tax=unclassified Streptococcus TaxID=2608887 RepID=UPI00066FBAC0|nr:MULTISPECIES: DMT family transporter [unclassified Streptococcus]TCD45860.1 DMT family transporter [Streptococcus sp. X16XC17]
MQKQYPFLGHMAAIFCVFVWGTSFLISKYLMDHISPITLIPIRCFIAYISLWIIHPVWHINWKEEIQFLLAALFGNTLYFLTENLALTMTQTSNVSILVTTSPLMTAFILQFSKKEDGLNWRQWLAYSISFIGVILVVLNGVLGLKLNPLGDLLSLGSALSWTIYSFLILKCQTNHHSSLFVMRKIMGYGCLLSLPFLAFSENSNFSVLLTPFGFSSLAYLGVICSALCYILWSLSIKQIGTLRTNIYIYAIPLVTMAAGALLLSEIITLTGAIGAALILTGMILSTRWE